MEVLKQKLNGVKQETKMKKLFLVFLLGLTSCYYPKTITTQVVAEKMDRKGKYYIIASDGFDEYKITDIDFRVPLRTEVLIHQKGHYYEFLQTEKLDTLFKSR